MRTLFLAVSLLSLAALPACKPKEVAPKGPAGAGVTTPDKLTLEAPKIEAPDQTVEPLLYANGFGSLTIGMTKEQVIKVAGEPDPNYPPPIPDSNCEIMSTLTYPELELMLEDGKLTRVTMHIAKYKTDKGIIIGATADEVKAAYGATLKIEPHKYYEAPAEYLTAWEAGDGSNAASRGVRYETNEKGIVTLAHAGSPSIEYVEGCL
jgi:hypothetical protein